MSEPLPEYDVTAVLCRRPAATHRDVERRTWTLRLPAVDQEHADDAAYGIATAINEASGFAWKLPRDRRQPAAIPVNVAQTAPIVTDAPLDLDALKRLCNAASDEPWRAEPGSAGEQLDGTPWPKTYVQPLAADGTRNGPRFEADTEADAEFIAAARTALPALRVRLLETFAELDAMRADRDSCRSALNVVVERRDQARDQLVELEAAAQAEIGRLRTENDALSAAIEPYGECQPDCDCGDHRAVPPRRSMPRRPAVADTTETPMPPLPDWLIQAADVFTATYTRRVNPLGLVAAAYVAGWDARGDEPSAEVVRLTAALRLCEQ